MTKKELQETYQRVSSHARRTPVLTSRLINEMAGCEIWFKCENFQKMGAFKYRGAINAILQIPQNELAKGVVTHSSGNFAQAVSLASKDMNIPAHVVMPTTAPQVKRDAVRDYGGIVVECAPTMDAREEAVAKIQQETGASFLHPSNQKPVILAQGTAAMEFLEDYDFLEKIIVPVGGGGLLAGTALACKHFSQSCLCIGAEPHAADDAYRSLQEGKIVYNETADTIADGLRTHLGDINFPVIYENVERIVRVKEESIIRAMRLIWERMKIIVEPSSAIALAAIFTKPDYFRGQKIGIIISGGNVDLSNLPF